MMEFNVDERRVVKGDESTDEGDIDESSDDDGSVSASERDVNRDGIVGKDVIVSVVSSMLKGSICK